jgi:hypothetical protein
MWQSPRSEPGSFPEMEANSAFLFSQKERIDYEKYEQG